MKANRRRWAILVTGLIAVAGSVGGYHALRGALDRRILVSCNNHQGLLRFALYEYAERNDGALPYVAGIAGYEMLARFPGIIFGAVNCNHAAPRCRVGGWQAVNVRPETWHELVRRWPHPLGERPIPFAWCGKPSRTGYRIVAVVQAFQVGPGLSISHQYMAEEELRTRLLTLNALLADLDEPLSEPRCS